ncbi:MAG TPA: ketoacyl-ACP synthase III [candidate division Zixibacteria bacterium]|nr:ketoacyl-ACP synthase III [candidate division Zixibacteria bacterium]
MRSKILATGSNLPAKILTNADLEKLVETSDEWIVSRSGIRERRIVESADTASSLSLPAAKTALSRANLNPGDLDAIIVATITPDMAFPSTACLMQNMLGCRQIPCFDISAGCTGFVYAMKIADAMITTGQYRNILVVGVELLTKITDWTDRSTCVLFGDGAGAAILAPTDDDTGLLGSYWSADGSFAPLLEMPAGGSRMPASEKTVKENLHTVKMLGNETFKAAVRAMEEASLEGIKSAGLEKADIDWLIPHQANIRIIEFTAKRLGISMDKVIITLEKYGNTSAASVPIALDEAMTSGKIKSGDNVLLVAFGAGFTWGSIVFKA